MIRKGIARLNLVVAAAALALALLPTRAAHADELAIVLEVTDDGYRCVQSCDVVQLRPGTPSWDLGLNIKQGQQVTVTFVWAHETFTKEKHIFVLAEYGVESNQIDATNRRASIRFIADKTGDFNLYCDLFCDLHNDMQSSFVTIKRDASAPTSATYVSTSVELTASKPAWVVGREPLVLEAVVKDASRSPVTNVEVTFHVSAEFAGTTGAMFIGRAKTNDEGVARLVHDSPLPEGERTVTARFRQVGIYDGGDQSLSIQVMSPSRPAVDATSRLEDLRDWGTTLLALVMLSTWAVLAFVVFQIVSIRGARPD